MPGGSGVILACIGFYLALCVAVGLWSLRRTRSPADFFVAGRRLGALVVAMAWFSSTVSGFAFVGGPGLMYRTGMSSVWMIASSVVAACVGIFLLGKRLRIMAELTGAISLPGVVAARYRSESLRFSCSLAIVLGVLGYLATQIRAMATVIQVLLEHAEWGTELTWAWCVAIAVGILVFYCVTGGILASVYTDLIQGLMMIVASVLIFLAVTRIFDGGMGELTAIVAADDPEAISPFGTLGILTCLSWFLLFAVGTAGQPHIITKLMMIRDLRSLRSILPIAVVAGFLSGLLWLGIGLVMRALVLDGRHPPLSQADAAAPEFLLGYVSPLLAGLVFAGLFAAIMSTADGFLNIGAAALVHDLPRALWGRPARRQLLAARLATVALAAVAAWIAFASEDLLGLDLIGLLGAFGWATFAAALVPVVAIGLNWKRATPLAANCTILFSLACNLGLEISDIRIPHGISGGAISLVLSLILFISLSLLTPPRPLDPDIEAAMEL